MVFAVFNPLEEHSWEEDASFSHFNFFLLLLGTYALLATSRLNEKKNPHCIRLSIRRWLWGPHVKTRGVKKKALNDNRVNSGLSVCLQAFSGKWVTFACSHTYKVKLKGPVNLKSFEMIAKNSWRPHACNEETPECERMLSSFEWYLQAIYSLAESGEEPVNQISRLMERNEERGETMGGSGGGDAATDLKGWVSVFFCEWEGRESERGSRWVVCTFQAPPAARFPSELKLVHFLIVSLTPALLLSNNHHDKKGSALCELLVPCSRVAWQRSDDVLALIPLSKFFVLNNLLAQFPRNWATTATM